MNVGALGHNRTRTLKASGRIVSRFLPAQGRLPRRFQSLAIIEPLISGQKEPETP
jgi:hypothetical protein